MKGKLAEFDSMTDVRLPFSNQIVYGKLDNGLTYYIRQNDLPLNKIEIRLNVRTGSLNETDDERGLAHFVEHMAFNGTKNYKGNEVIRFMDEAGLTFGHHSNAYTSTNNTNYRLSIPADNEQLFNESLKIMRDWADGITFEPGEIEKEKGVIIEEWRNRNDVSGRIRVKTREHLLEGSLYPDRDPIGLMNIVENADKKLLKGYYDKWYTPQNISIIIVGNMDTGEAKKLIEQYFSNMEKKAELLPADKTVPFPEKIRFHIITDPELTSTGVSITYFEEEGIPQTYGELKKSVLESGTLNMLNKRVTHKILTKQIDLLSFRGNKSNVSANIGITRFGIQTTPKSIQKDLELMLAEIEKARRFGFTKEELLEFTSSQQAYLTKAASPEYKYPSDKYADIITNYDTYGGYLTEFSQDKKLYDTIFTHTDLSDYNKAFQNMISNRSVLVLVTVPEKEAGDIKLNAESFDIIQSMVFNMELEPEAEVEQLKTLMEQKPNAGKIVDEKEYKELNARLFTYSNGVRLFVQLNDVDKNRFVMTAVKPGGTSSMTDNEVIINNLVSKTVSSSGFQGISKRRLNAFLADKFVHVLPIVTENSFEFTGGGDVEDMEVFFQLLFKSSNEAFVDEDVLFSIKKNHMVLLNNFEKNKKEIFFRDAARDIYNNAYRRTYLLAGDLQNITADKVYNLYEKGFSDLNNFVFVISGNVDMDKTAEFGRIYLGGLPAKKSLLKAVDRGIKIASKEKFIQLNGDTEQKSTVHTGFDKDIMYVKDGQYKVALLRKILNQRLRERIREDMGSVYSIGVMLKYTYFPAVKYSGRVQFTCDPQRRDEILWELFKIINDTGRNGVTQAELNIAKTQYITQLMQSAEQNKYLSSTAAYSFLKGEEPVSTAEIKDIIDRISLEDINALSKYLLTDLNIYTAVFNPEDEKAALNELKPFFAAMSVAGGNTD